MHAIIVTLLGVAALATAGHLPLATYGAAPVVVGTGPVLAQPTFVRSVVAAPAVVHTASYVPVATSHSYSHRAPVVKAYAVPAPVLVKTHAVPAPVLLKTHAVPAPVVFAAPAPVIKTSHTVLL